MWPFKGDYSCNCPIFLSKRIWILEVGRGRFLMVALSLCSEQSARGLKFAHPIQQSKTRQWAELTPLKLVSGQLICQYLLLGSSFANLNSLLWWFLKQVCILLLAITKKQGPESPFPPETARKSDKIHAAVFFQVLETGITDRLERKEIREVSSLKVSYLKWRITLDGIKSRLDYGRKA